MEFSSFVITAKGQALMAKLMQGTSKCDFTAIKLSSQSYTEAQLPSLTTLASIKQAAPITKKTVVNATSIQIEGAIDNKLLVTGYTIQTLGIFANDPDLGEILYAASRATTPGYVPPYNGVTVSGIYFKFGIAVGNAANVDITLDPAGYASIGDVVELAESIDRTYLKKAGGDAGSTIVVFAEQGSATVSDIASGTKLSVLLGKVKKMLGDLFSFKDRATGFATAAQGAKADSALQSVPDATTAVKGVALLGASGGAARYGQKADMGLGSVDNTSDSAKVVASAAKLTTARTISISGKATAAGISFNGTANVALSVTDVDATKLNGQAASYYGVAAKQYPFSVAVSAWTGTGEPYTATITVTGVPANAIGIIGLSDAATAAERESTREAIISPATSTAANTVKLVADGYKPTMALPMVATIVG